MSNAKDTMIAGLAESCVGSMGDIFWDYEESRDGKLDFAAPQTVAINAIAATLHAFEHAIKVNARGSNRIRPAGREVAIDAGTDPSQTALFTSLLRDGEWSEDDAREFVRLSQKYGTGTLHRAVALTESKSSES
jgi:hypothetical protein